MALLAGGTWGQGGKDKEASAGQVVRGEGPARLRHHGKPAVMVCLGKVPTQGRRVPLAVSSLGLGSHGPEDHTGPPAPLGLQPSPSLCPRRWASHTTLAPELQEAEPGPGATLAVHATDRRARSRPGLRTPASLARPHPRPEEPRRTLAQLALRPRAPGHSSQHPASPH